MKKILSVSVDTITLNIISSLLLEHTGDFEILTAESIKESDAILRKIKIDMFIIDLTRPSLNDLETLKTITKNNVRIPFIVMTGFETGEIESTIKSIGAIRYFEKPVDFKALADKVAEEMEGGVGGAIHGISLASFLQMSEMEKTSCTLKIQAGEQKEGRLYLLKGALVAAATASNRKEEAVYEILGWNSPMIEIEDPDPSIEREIKTPLMTLLMEGLKRKDEKSGRETDKSKLSAPKAKKVSISSGTERIQAEEEATLRAETPKAAEKNKTATAQEILKDLPAELAEKAQTKSNKISAAGEILKKQRRVANMVKVGILAVLLVILVCMWFIFGAPWLAERQYNKMLTEVGKTRQEERIAILDEYIAGANDSYARKAKIKRAEVVHDMQTMAFDEAVTKVGQLPIDENYQEKAEALYKDYLQKYPGSEYAEQIEQLLSQIPAVVKDADLRRLKAIPPEKLAVRIEAYNQYLADHPNSTNVPIVQKMIRELGEKFYTHILAVKKTCDKKKEWRKCLKLCDYFAAKFGGHDRSNAVAKLKKSIVDQQEWLAVTEQLDERELYSAKAEEIYRQYLREHPDSSLKRIVKSRIAQIQKKQNAKVAWENVLRNAKNENLSIFDRVETVENYLGNKPPEPYNSNAQQTLAWLNKKKTKELAQLAVQQQAAQQQQQRQQIIKAKEAAVRAALRRSGAKYVEQRQETLTDTQTGLTWCMLDSSVMTEDCLNYKAAKIYVNNLTTGGYTDWRLPTPSELIIIYNNDPAFPAVEGTRWYWTSEVFSAAWQKKVNTVKRNSSGNWQKSETDLDQCGAVRAVRP